MSWLLAFLVILYTVLMLLLLVAWRRLPKISVPQNYLPQTFLSVLIPVRNEAGNILNLVSDLENQHFPLTHFEVLVLDDNSDDDTAVLVQKFQQSSALDLKLLPAEKGRGSGKKSMLALGLQKAKGSLILQTDGDCRVGPNWLKTMEYAYVNHQARFISGPVTLNAGSSFFGKMQVTEFASLIGSGASSIGLGFPNMCNGANLAFEKAAFEAVNGYAGNEKIASGDDEFLMHKIQKQFPGSVYFLKAADALVRTDAQPSVRKFLAQRVRWASKFRHYQNLPAQLIGALVFGTNLLLFFFLMRWLFSGTDAAEFWPWYLLKCAADFVFLGSVLRFLKQGRYLLYFLPWQVVYFPYVIYCALAGLRGKYQWKGRTFTNP